MHYQAAPHLEAKLVRCTMGAIWDVMIDLRPESPTFSRHVGIELSAESRQLVYIPEGFAHGFQTLTDDVEVFYQMNRDYRPKAAAGVRYDDPAFGIAWPLEVARISERDRNLADFDASSFSLTDV
jgi:dTDP-4-dehydrorhamnose 3,5-epimerase